MLAIEDKLEKPGANLQTVSIEISDRCLRTWRKRKSRQLDAYMGHKEGHLNLNCSENSERTHLGWQQSGDPTKIPKTPKQPFELVVSRKIGWKCPWNSR